MLLGMHACIFASHTRTQGFDVAKKALLEFLDKFKTDVDPADREVRGGQEEGHHTWTGALQHASSVTAAAG
jgi:hypothetical protein